MAITLTVNVQNQDQIITDGSFSFQPKIGERSRCTFTVRDDNNTLSFKKWDPVKVTDSVTGRLFTGFVNTANRSKIPTQNCITHDIDCIDIQALADIETTNKKYVNQYPGIVAADMASKLKYKGVTANYAIRNDDTQADFASGNLSGTHAASDGTLQLAPAGTTVTLTQNTNATLGDGTLNNLSTSNNTLLPTSTKAIKMQCQQTGIGQSNTYTYVKIFSPASTFTVVLTRYLYYELWVDPSSPEIKFGVDITFTDNTTLRDNFTTGEISQNNLSPHPGTDLSGYADQNAWYGRTFDLTSFAGKNIAYISIACEGDKAGTYTAYFRNIQYLNSDFTNNQYFFQNALNVSPPQQLQNLGYASTSVTVVDTYDANSSYRLSNTYSISDVGLLKTSFITWDAVRLDPTDGTYKTSTDLQVKYSIDGGNSYIVCQNNAALPDLPAGSNVSGATIAFGINFFPTNANLETPLILRSLQLTLYPSYQATKSDVAYSATVSTAWQNTGTFTNTQVSGLFLQLAGSTRYWNANQTNNEMANMTLMGGGATGPNSANSCFHYVNKKQLSLQVHQSTEARSRCDFAGQIADGTFEFDAYIDNSNMKNGCFYRTTGTSNYDAQYGYAVEVSGSTIALQKGSNSNTAANGTRTQVASATVNLTSQAQHRIKVIFSGSSHKIYLDDVQVISATDSTYTSAGYCGFRVSNGDPSNGYIAFFDNFGLMKSLTGTWVSNNISLTSAATYDGRSSVYWEDYSIDSQSTNLLVEASVNGGSTYATCTNGGTIPGLTAGQSLSGVNLKFRVTLTTAAATSMPQIRYLVARVCGQYSSSGTRVSPMLDLSPAGTAGSTLLSWDADTPTGTTVTGATSLNGTSFTSVNNGGSISGITGQPDATLDTFDAISRGSYLSTARTGGTAVAYVWDTKNSRLTVSGGTNALLLNSSVSADDVDLMLDLDKADCSGLVWRRTDNSNFYELDIFDASSSAGATNVMRLYKIVSNVKTQIGTDIAISFTRNGKHRIRLTMVGNSINVYLDGSNVRTASDAALSASGLCGLINVSGSAQFYNLQIQPLGDNLSNVKAWGKLTLSSTDPTQTPKVNGSVLAALSPDIELGDAPIPTLDYTRKTIASNMNDLSDKANKYWQIDQNFKLTFAKREAIPSPWLLTSNDVLLDGIDVSNSGDIYRNRMILQGVLGTKDVIEQKIGDSKATSWTLEYAVDSVSSITVNGQTKTIGLKGTTGYDFYYEVGSNSLAQDSSGTLLTDTDVLEIAYVGRYRTEVIRDNMSRGDFPGTISQEEMAETSGLDNLSFTLLNQASAAQSANGNTSDIDVSDFETINIDINITAHSGTNPTVQFFLKRKDAAGNYSLLWQSDVNSATTDQISKSIGPGCTIPESLGTTVQLSWTIGGSASPSVTFSASIKGTLDPEAANIGVVEAVEDVTDQNLSIAGAEAYGDSLLQKYGVIGRTLKCQTLRSGLWPGQYTPVFIPEHDFNDATMLITDMTLKQKLTVDNSGNKSQLYFWQTTLTENSNLGSWSNLLSNVIKKVVKNG